MVMIDWAWSYVTFQRGARVITGRWRPGDRSRADGSQTTEELSTVSGAPRSDKR
jgi:hypothetical protein